MHETFLKLIEEFDSICIFRHQNPDGDAFGSQFGLATFINDNFPNKKVYCCGNHQDKNGYFPKTSDVSDDIIRKSLAIVLDTPTVERVDGQNFLLAPQCFKIDHHPNVNPFKAIEYVDIKAGACCQLVALMLEKTGLTLSKKCCDYLLFGIMTDTLNLTTSNTSVNTVKAYGLLMEHGGDIVKVSRHAMEKSVNQYNATLLIGRKAKYENNICYSIVTLKDCYDNNLTPADVYDYVNCLRGVIGVDAWGLFTQIEDGSYKVSLRSYDININPIAVKHNGGGHAQASGAKAKDINEVLNIIQELKNIAK